MFGVFLFSPQSFLSEKGERTSEIRSPVRDVRKKESLEIFSIEEEINNSERRVHVFYDLLCFYCTEYFIDTFALFLELDFVQTNSISFEFHFFPVFGERSFSLQREIYCFEEQKELWEFIQAFSSLETRTPEAARELIFSMDINTEEYTECLSSNIPNERREQDKIFSEKHSITVVPSILIGDEIWRGNVPPENLQNSVQKYLKNN
jgi:protein-disulfide isomerase